MTELHWYYLALGFGWIPALVIIGAITFVGFWAYIGLITVWGWIESRL
jgi:hypothetical protein